MEIKSFKNAAYLALTIAAGIAIGAAISTPVVHGVNKLLGMGSSTTTSTDAPKG